MLITMYRNQHHLICMSVGMSVCPEHTPNFLCMAQLLFGRFVGLYV